MGHKSIQVTVDTCGHLIPGDNIEWIDVLDKAPAAPQTLTQEEEFTEKTLSDSKNWLPPRDSNLRRFRGV